MINTGKLLGAEFGGRLWRLRHYLLVALIKSLVRWGLIRPLVSIYLRRIERVVPEDGDTDSRKPTLLALRSDRFRGDLQVLADSHEFRVLAVRHPWVDATFEAFAAAPVRAEVKRQHHLYFQRDDSTFGAIRDGNQGFLRRFLPLLFKHLKVDCVLSPRSDSTRDFDWGVVSKEIGVPYVVIQRENLASEPAQAAHFRKLYGSMGTFAGDHIIVHNEPLREAYLESGFVNPDQISALGCLRMDEYVRRVKSRVSDSNSSRPRVVLFSFCHGNGLYGILNNWSEDGTVGFVKLFEEVHAAIAELAILRPEIDFVIKPKWTRTKNTRDWREYVADAFEKRGIRAEDIPNLEVVDPDADAHDLVFDANVVCGFRCFLY